MGCSLAAAARPQSRSNAPAGPSLSAKYIMNTANQQAVARYRRRKYRPLNVKSWSEGFYRLIGWILVIIFAVVTAGLAALYEVRAHR